MPKYLSLSSTQLFNWHDKNRLSSFLTYIHYLSIFVKEIGENELQRINTVGKYIVNLEPNRL